MSGELKPPLDPLQEAIVTKKIDEMLRGICDNIEEQIKGLDVHTGNPHMAATRLACRIVTSAIKEELLK